MQHLLANCPRPKKWPWAICRLRAGDGTGWAGPEFFFWRYHRFLFLAVCRFVNEMLQIYIHILLGKA